MRLKTVRLFPFGRFLDKSWDISQALAIEPAERALAERVLELVPRDLAYARVDVAPGADGRPQLMELELVEPSLFLLQSPPALERFVNAIAARLA